MLFLNQDIYLNSRIYYLLLGSVEFQGWSSILRSTELQRLYQVLFSRLDITITLYIVGILLFLPVKPSDYYPAIYWLEEGYFLDICYFYYIFLIYF